VINDGQWIQRFGLLWPAEGLQRLDHSLERTYRGYTHDLRSPLYGAIQRTEIIEILERKIGDAPYEELYELNKREIEKIGSFSIMLPYDMRAADVLEYFRPKPISPDMDLFDRALSLLSTLIEPGALRSSRLSTAYAAMPKGTSLGPPWMTSEREKALWYLDKAQSDRVPKDFYPSVLGWRGQAQGLLLPPKQRVVWQMPHDETILGLSILNPVLKKLRVKPGFSPWQGDLFVDQEMTHILKLGHGRRILSMDYKSFDSSVSKPLIDVVRKLLLYWFSKADAPRINLLLDVFTTMDMLVPYRVMTGRIGGVPSGSALTNLVDSLINLFALNYLSLRLNNPIMACSILGDDAVVLFEDDWDAVDVSGVMNELGLNVSPEKQWISTSSSLSSKMAL